MFTNPVLVFDIETIPDIATGQKLHPTLANLSAADAHTALVAMRQAEAGTEFMQLPLHQIVCLSFLWVDSTQNKFYLKSLTQNEYSESDILATFFRAFDKKPAPTLVSWNGIGFDLPVLLYRALHHNLSAPNLFGDHKNSYISRYGNTHIDLMDKLSLHNYAYKQKLNTIAALCNLAGKGDLDGTQVVPMVQNNEWEKLATYCESDVLNTWFIYLQYLRLLGKISLEDDQALRQNTQNYLKEQLSSQNTPRHPEFITNFNTQDSP